MIIFFWCFSALALLGVGLVYVNSEPILSIVGFLGFFVFVGSGVDVIFPTCLKSFAEGEVTE